MQNYLCDITVLLDRSGSMVSCRSDAEGGLNEFVRRQKEQPGRAVFTLVQFDEEYEFVHRAKPIGEVGRLELFPRGRTALLDAVGRAVVETGERLKAMPETERPGLVVFVIVTDGRENASKEFKLKQVRDMIRHQQEAYGWQFTYLGANQDAFAEAGGLGIDAAAAANYTEKTAGVAFTAAASNVGRMRHRAAGGQSVNSNYTDDERRRMAGK